MTTLERTSGSRPGASDPVAELQGACKNYGPVAALRQLDFAVTAGEIVAVLGPNGAGKTTAVHLLLGLARPSAGRALLFGRDPRSAAARTRVGAMLQVSKVPETLTVREHVHLFSSYYPRPLPMAETLALAGLEELASRPFGKLSGGQRQRVLFALALCGDPDLLFLDEPTVGLDVEARRALWSRISARAHGDRSGRSVLLTTHYLEEADALADRIVLLDRGRVLAEGSPAEIKARVAGRQVRCRTRLGAAEVAAIAGVTSVREVERGVDGRTAAGGESQLELFVREAEQVVRELLARDPSLAALEVRGAGLEEAFLALTSPASAGEAAHSEVAA